ncbi:crosslink repair DNA glycosylase YcaQ family protein [Paenibacillus sp. GYB004]|uniref:DNA glycosylase AlkZ-like family protein n=1 Tax=Paenibacillus sp. GYB004 TaxID=2994393 RepID=UPI002F96326E
MFGCRCCIIPVEDWPYFERYRLAARQHTKRYPEMEALIEQVRAHIQNHGALSSDDLKLDGNFSWQSVIHWSSGNNSSRSKLEQMYSTGELIIHHKKGTRKYYDIAGRYIQPNLLNAPELLEGELESPVTFARVRKQVSRIRSAIVYVHEFLVGGARDGLN